MIGAACSKLFLKKGIHELDRQIVAANSHPWQDCFERLDSAPVSIRIRYFLGDIDTEIIEVEITSVLLCQIITFWNVLSQGVQSLSCFGPATGAAVCSNCMSSGSKCGGRKVSTTQVLLFLQLLFLLLLFLLPFWQATKQATNHCQFQSGGCPLSALRPAHAQIWAIKSKHQSNAKAKAPKHTHKQHAQNLYHSLRPKTLRDASSLFLGIPVAWRAQLRVRMIWMMLKVLKSLHPMVLSPARPACAIVTCAQSSTSRSSSLAFSLCPEAKMALAGKHVHRKGITRWGHWRSSEKQPSGVSSPGTSLAKNWRAPGMCCHTKETIGFQRITLFSGLALSWSQFPACATHSQIWSIQEK